MTQATDAGAGDVERQLRENVATMLHRSGLNKSALATAVGLSQPTMSRRISGALPWLFWEVKVMAEFFGVTIDEMTTDLPSFDEWQARGGLRACRDSNPKPSDLEPVALELVHRIPAAVTYLADYRRSA